MATDEFEGDRDDRILDLFDEYTREADASIIAESFFSTGYTQLENFIDRHDGAFGDGAQERMYATLAMVRNQAELVSEQGDRGLGNAELRHLIVQKVIPTLKKVMRQERRQQAGRGPREPIPGVLTSRHLEKLTEYHDKAERQIEEYLRNSRSAQRLRDLAIRNRGFTPSPQDQDEELKLRAFILGEKVNRWTPFNEKAQGGFTNKIKTLQRQIEKLNLQRSALATTMHGHGGGAALDAALDRSMARADSNLRRRMSTPSTPSPWMGKPRLSRAEHKQLLKAKRRGSYSGPAQEEPGLRLRGGSRSKSRPKEWKPIDTRTPPSRPHTPGPKRPSRRSRSREVEAPKSDEDVLDLTQLEDAPPPEPPEYQVDEPRSEEDVTGMGFEGIALSTSSDDMPIQKVTGQLYDVIIDPRHQNVAIGYWLPYADPRAYEQAFGFRAENVEDLFKKHHKFLNYQDTIGGLLQTMFDQNELAESDSEKFELDRPLPDVAAFKTLRVRWANQTLREILQRAAISKGPRPLNPTQNKQRLAVRVAPTERGLSAAQAHTLLGKFDFRVKNFHPKGLISQLWFAFKASKLGKRSELKDDKLLQFFAYHKARRVGDVSRSVSAAAEPFAAQLRADGLGQKKLKVLAPLFGYFKGSEPFSQNFWRKSIAKQAQLMGQISLPKRGGMTTAHDPNKWREIMKTTFEMTEEQIPVKAKLSRDYTGPDRELLWTTLATRLKPYMQIVRQRTKDKDYTPRDPRRTSRGATAGDWFASYASGVRVSDDAVRASMISQRSQSGSSWGDEETDEEPESKRREVEPELTPKRKPKAKTPKGYVLGSDYYKDIVGYHKYANIKSRPVHPLQPGFDPVFQWATEITRVGGRGMTLQRRSKADETAFATRLLSAAKNNASPNGYKPWSRPDSINLGSRKPKGKTDYQSEHVFMEKLAWNQYIMGCSGAQWGAKQGKSLNAEQRAKRDGLLFPRVPADESIFQGAVFDKNEEQQRNALEHYLGARAYNRVHTITAEAARTNPDLGSAPDLTDTNQSWNVKEYYDDLEAQIKSEYTLEASRWTENGIGDDFPIPDWKDRLEIGNQYETLRDSLPIIRAEARKRAKGGDQTIKVATKQADLPSKAPRVRKPRAGRTVGPMSPPKRRRRKPRFEPAPDTGTLPPVPVQSGSRTPSVVSVLADRLGLPTQIPEDVTNVSTAAPTNVSALSAMTAQTAAQTAVSDEGDEDAWEWHERQQQDIREQDERARQARAAYQQPSFLTKTRGSSRTAVRAQVVRAENYNVMPHTHLLQTDNNVQPVMGAVHIVHAGDDADRERHIMLDVHAKMNKGQREIVARGRRGPFRDKGGRSTVMDSSAHIIYRKRAGAFEITVRRGVIGSELQQLLSKLSMHRLSMSGSYLVIIKGNKRYRLGRLSEFDLRELRDLIGDCVDSYGSCGLEVVEAAAEAGALYKPEVHRARFKSDARRKAGPAGRRRANI